MSNIIIQMFSYDFLLRALIVGTLISICASLLGVTLVLKKYSMIGDGLSHVSFGALAVATVMNVAPLKLAIPVVLIVAFFLLKLNENSKINGDEAIAIISSSSLALGVMAISLTSGMNLDIYNYLFGSILTISQEDVLLSLILALVVLFMFIFFYNKIFAVTFDENFSKATGIKTDLYNIIIASLTAITIVLGMRLMGSLLISSLIIFPALTAMQVAKNFKKVVITSVIISLISFFIGLILSYIYASPVGSSIVLVNLTIFILFYIINIVKIKIKK